MTRSPGRQELYTSLHLLAWSNKSENSSAKTLRLDKQDSATAKTFWLLQHSAKEAKCSYRHASFLLVNTVFLLRCWQCKHWNVLFSHCLVNPLFVSSLNRSLLCLLRLLDVNLCNPLTLLCQLFIMNQGDMTISLFCNYALCEFECSENTPFNNYFTTLNTNTVVFQGPSDFSLHIAQTLHYNLNLSIKHF